MEYFTSSFLIVSLFSVLKLFKFRFKLLLELLTIFFISLFFNFLFLILFEDVNNVLLKYSLPKFDSLFIAEDVKLLFKLSSQKSTSPLLSTLVFGSFKIAFLLEFLG